MTAPEPHRAAGAGRPPAWIEIGVAAGALAGVMDVAFALAGRIGGMSIAKGLRLALIGAGLLALAGGVAGALVAAGAWLSARTRAPARTASWLWALAAAPLVAHDAFALFTGHQAAQIPGHRAISVALALAGVAAVQQVGRRLATALAAAPRRGRWFAGLVAGAFALQAANAWILPRLYPWFHLTLSIGTLGVYLGAVRIMTPGPWRAGRVALLGALAVAGAAAAVAQLRSSQVMRYAASERTALASLVLRAVPGAWLARAPAAAAARREAPEAALAPLPEGPRRPDADVLLITIDAVRADHVGAYGYRRPTTPHLDALAKDGVRFTRAYAQAPHTSFSIASMLTGKYFATLARLAPGERHDPIASVLRTYGWRTAAFYPPAVFYIDAQKLKAYADTNFDFEYVKFEFIDAERRVDQVLAYYDEVKPPRSFAWVHFFEPHEPYDRHPRFGFGDRDVDRYDGEIAYTDAAIGRLIRETRARRPGTVIVITADHGEEFDDHGGRYHGSSLFDEQVRVPLVISIPGVRPHVVDGQVELLDITPTVLNLLNIPVPVRMRGTDLGPWLGPTPAPAARLPPAFAEVEDKRMVVYGNEKLLCDLHRGFCAYYDLDADPGERRNAADDRPDRAAALRGRLDDWLDGHVRFEPLLAQSGDGGGGSLEGAMIPKAIERGRLGDLTAAPDLAALLGTTDATVLQRREAAELLAGLPPQPALAPALARAAADPDRGVADWAAIAATRAGSAATRARVQAIVADPAGEPRRRVRAALALATAGDVAGVAVLGAALAHCEDTLLCREVIVSLGKLRDARAVPALLGHLGVVLNRREVVEALGEIGDPAATEALIERLRTDEYVPVRVEAAKSLARLGDPRLAARVDEAVRFEHEAAVTAAARAAAAALRARPKTRPKK